VVEREVPDLYTRWVVTPHRPGAPTTEWMYAYQDPLQTLAEWGMVGMALWIGLFSVVAGAAWVGARRGASRALTVCSRAALLGLGVLLVHGLFDFPLQVPAIQTTAALWAAVALGCRTQAGQVPGGSEPLD
jgi:O-antigen ligase